MYMNWLRLYPAPSVCLLVLSSQSVYMSICQSECPSVCLSVCMTSVCIYVCTYVRMHASTSVCCVDSEMHVDLCSCSNLRVLSQCAVGFRKRPHECLPTCRSVSDWSFSTGVAMVSAKQCRVKLGQQESAFRSARRAI